MVDPRTLLWLIPLAALPGGLLALARRSRNPSRTSGLSWRGAHDRLDWLGFDECQDLLRSASAGRLALSTPDGCHIAVLAYFVVEDEVVIAAPSYSVPATYAEGRMVAFEVDNVGTGAHDGWSVILRGRAEAFANRREVDRITRELSPPMGDAGAVNVYLCIPVDDVSGRHWSASAGHAPPYPDSAS